jgi:YebC/PmpR family DNA-binding regulatory protein
MGRTFENRKGTMMARWDRMAKVFTRISKDITMAVKSGGPSADSNPTLRRVIQNARAANMPKDKVETAIKRATGAEAVDYEELVYEGYAPHGIAILVETATDNPTRTIANVRMHFNKCNGNLGATGSVNYLFKRMGVFKLTAAGLVADELELDLIDDGLEELEADKGENGEDILVLRCAFGDFGTLAAALEKRHLPVVSSSLEYIPLGLTSLTEEQEADVLKLIDRLEQDEDVQNVFHTLA